MPRVRRSTSARRCAPCAVAIVAAVALLAIPAVAATRADDEQLAETGTFVLSDFPAGFASEPTDDTTNAEKIQLAKGVAGCAPYVALQKVTGALPEAKSPDFSDASRSVRNEVGVFKSARAASAALALYAKPSIVGCLKTLFEKQVRQDPALKGKVDTLVVSIERQDIAGLGDDSVVYEGKIELTGLDGSTLRLGVGNAAVQVGRTVDVVTYSTESADLTEILGPAIDASVGRLRTALAGDTA